MQTRITINTEGAAFGDDSFEDSVAEVARILRELADKIEVLGGLPAYLPLHDINGNNCGNMETD